MAPDETVEKPPRMLPQRAGGGKLAGEASMARVKHIDTQPQFVAVDL